MHFPAVILRDPDSVDVRSFGARGDDQTDNTEAIQAAIDAAFARSIPTGRRIRCHIPPGIYRHRGLYYWGYRGHLDMADGAQLRCTTARPCLSFGEVPSTGNPQEFANWPTGHGFVPVESRPDSFGKLDSSAAPAPGVHWGIRSIKQPGGTRAGWIFPVSGMCDTSPNIANRLSRSPKWSIAGAFCRPDMGVIGNCNLMSCSSDARPISFKCENQYMIVAFRTAEYSSFEHPTRSQIRILFRFADSAPIAGMLRFVVQYDKDAPTLAQAMSCWMRDANHGWTKVTGSQQNGENWSSGQMMQKNIFVHLTVGGISGTSIASDSDYECHGIRYATGHDYVHDATALTRVDGNATINDSVVLHTMPPESGVRRTVFQLLCDDFKSSRAGHDRRWAITRDNNNNEAVGYYWGNLYSAANGCWITGGVLEGLNSNSIALFMNATVNDTYINKTKLNTDLPAAYGLFKTESSVNNYPCVFRDMRVNGSISAFHIQKMSGVDIENCHIVTPGRAAFAIRAAAVNVSGGMIGSFGDMDSVAIVRGQGDQGADLTWRNMGINMEGAGVYAGPLFDLQRNTPFGNRFFFENVFTDNLNGNPVFRLDDAGTDGFEAYIEAKGIRCERAGYFVATNGPKFRGEIATVGMGRTHLVAPRFHVNNYGPDSNVALKTYASPGGGAPAVPVYQ